MKKITVLIPALNEETGIGRVIENVPLEILSRNGYETDILVVDNNSSDNTVKIALSKGARVIREMARGKGNALITGFRHIQANSDYVVTIDGDDTYKPKEILRLIEPLENGFCDVIAGSRIGGKTIRGSLIFSHLLVNWILAFFVRIFYHVNITDVLTGFIAMKSSVIKTLIPNLHSTNFTIEMEMFTKLRKLGFEIFSVPITYDRRMGKSKLNSLQDGLKIVLMFFNNLSWSPISRPSRFQILNEKIKMFFT